MEKLNFTLIKGDKVEVARPHELGIGRVEKVDETYHIWIVNDGVVEFDKIYGVGEDWHISQKLTWEVTCTSN